MISAWVTSTAQFTGLTGQNVHYDAFKTEMIKDRVSVGLLRRTLLRVH